MRLCSDFLIRVSTDCLNGSRFLLLVNRNNVSIHEARLPSLRDKLEAEVEIPETKAEKREKKVEKIIKKKGKKDE